MLPLIRDIVLLILMSLRSTATEFNMLARSGRKMSRKFEKWFVMNPDVLTLCI